MMERVNPDSPSLYLSLTGVRGMVSMSILPWCLDRMLSGHWLGHRSSRTFLVLDVGRFAHIYILHMPAAR